MPNTNTEPGPSVAPLGALAFPSPYGVRSRKHPTPTGRRSSIPSTAGLIFAVSRSAREFAPPLRFRAKRTDGKLLVGW